MADAQDPKNTDDGSIELVKCLFPEITDSEFEELDSETFIISERRAKVMVLYRRQFSMRQIADQLGCSLSTVQRDLQAVMIGYRKLAMQSAQDAIANQIQELQHIASLAQASFDRSLGETLEVTTGKRGAGQTGQDNATVKRRTKYGDPRFLKILIECNRERSKLQGLMNPQDLSTSAATSIKYIAGVNLEDV